MNNFYKKNKKYIALITVLSTAIMLFGGCTSTNDLSDNKEGIITGKIDFADINMENSENSTGEKNDSKTHKQVFFNTADSNFAKTKAGAYIISFKEELTKDHVITKVLRGESNLLQKPPKKLDKNLFLLQVADENQQRLRELLKYSGEVEYIEPDYTVKAQKSPSDPYYSRQWNLDLLALETVWEHNRNNNGVRVAILDTGIHQGHPDLTDNIIQGRDIIDNNDNPEDTDTSFSHGTHVAGIIGAVTNNNRGVAGMNWQIDIMPVRVIPSGGAGSVSYLIEGIKWAVDNGAHIINLSLAASGGSRSLKEAVEYAVENGVTVIAAAGNNARESISYPAAYESVISVGAVGPTAEKARYSNYGPELDLVAPGGDDRITTSSENTILSTSGKDDYALAQGTSMASPHVSAAAAMLYGEGIEEPEQIRHKLKDTAKSLDSTGMQKNHYGAGLLDINRALNLKETEGDKENEDEKEDKNNDDENPRPSVENVRIYTINADKNEDPKADSSAQKTEPEPDGDYQLSSPTGERKVIAWLDSNEDGKINKGDYLASHTVKIKSGEKREINLELKLLE